jgi:hypothetical protein
MTDSGQLRAGLPETESLTSQRSGQGSKTTAGRKRAPRARADLYRENRRVRWVGTATHTLTKSPNWVLQQVKRAGPGWLEGAGVPAVPDLTSGPSATTRARNGQPGFRGGEKATAGAGTGRGNVRRSRLFDLDHRG